MIFRLLKERKLHKVKILGIDPGYAIVGYGSIIFSDNKFLPLCYGAIQTNAKCSFYERLAQIYDDMNALLIKVRPDVMAIEKLYFQKNHKTAIDVAQARGIILLSAKQKNIPIFEYTPLQVKTVVTGYGKAKKNQVMNMTKRLLSLGKMPSFDDTTDALAIAICHARACGSDLRLKMLKRSYKYSVL